MKSVLRAWRLLKAQPDQKMEFVSRLARRLTKALCHGARAGTITRDTLSGDIDELRNASSPEGLNGIDVSVAQGWEEWDATRLEMDDYAKKRDACLVGLSRMPIFFKAFDDTTEHYGMGHDNPIDLIAGCGSVSLGSEPYPLDIDNLSIEYIQQLAFLFGGVGDARHVMATLCGLSTAYSYLPEEEKPIFHAHLTLLDINATTIARDLCFFLLLHELNSTSGSDAIARAEIKATLMYMFCGVVMPPYCFDRLTRLFRGLSARLSSTDWALPTWIRLDTHTAISVVRSLEYWLSASKSARKMLARHEIAPPGTLLPALDHPIWKQPELRRLLERRVAEERQVVKRTLLNMPHEQLVPMLVDAGIVLSPVSPTAAREALLNNMDSLIHKEYVRQFGERRTFEMECYMTTKAFLPPEELRSRHPDLDSAWQHVRTGGALSRPDMLRARTHIENDWQPNITLFDHYIDDPKSTYVDTTIGYPEIQEEVFRIVKQIHGFNSPSVIEMRKTAWDVFNPYFEEVAAALKALESNVVLEFTMGELCAELAKMRHSNDTGRPRDFPTKYTRMWLSNVPDYTHGPLNLIVYVVPNLQDIPDAATASNSLLSPSVWKDDAEWWHTFTLLTIEEVPRYLACDIIRPGGLLGSLVLGPSPSLPRPLAKLATREELTTWLTRLLFNTLIPGKLPPPPGKLRLPHNIVAFFGILMYLSRIGYPGHWLSEFLERILSGRMVSNVTPYTGEYPIPVEERTRRVPSRTVRTDPWLVEFETIIATAYYAIPFPVSSALAPDFSNNPDDIALWEAEVRRAPSYKPSEDIHNTAYEPRVQLLFYRSDKLTAREVIENIQAVFEGKRTPVPGLFFVVTSPEHIKYQEKIQFRLSRLRVERMRAEKWSVVAYRNDTGMQGTVPAPISSWIAKS
ncbi:hypothetical protein OH76DRAFT_161993 [Lentinus brumalis]|uniref:DUF4470 domain-containing protein n=1 Tax=Lentinus brumalis TaxID=2498619 RepID=A0A371DIY4_9APHY|nr:hypothetical protein OH76DRAFT_161993 [Polyporus brumalis]